MPDKFDRFSSLPKPLQFDIGQIEIIPITIESFNKKTLELSGEGF